MGQPGRQFGDVLCSIQAQQLVQPGLHFVTRSIPAAAGADCQLPCRTRLQESGPCISKPAVIVQQQAVTINCLQKIPAAARGLGLSWLQS